MSARTLCLAVALGAFSLFGLPWILPTSSVESLRITADDAARPAAAAAAVNDLGWIGLTLEPAADGRLAVVAVFPGGPAAFAGLRAGDVVTDINGRKVSSAAAAATAIESIAPGQTGVIRATRGQQQLKLTVTAGSLRDFHARYVGEMMRRDPRHPQYGAQHGVSSADMQVELIRRQFEQNQRLEYAINHLRNEVQALRQELQAARK